MEMKKSKSRLVIVIAILSIFCSLAVFSSALQNTPYHEDSAGITLKSESHFCGNVPGTGQYKTISGKYITSAWVQINADGEKVAYDKSKTVNKSSSAVTYASTSCFNNPLKSQSFPYGWNY